MQADDAHLAPASPVSSSSVSGRRAIEADPHYRAVRAFMRGGTPRERRHGQIELSVIREIALALRHFPARAGGPFLQVQPQDGEILLFRDQLVQPGRPVIYDQSDRRDPDVRAATEFGQIDVEAARWPAPDGYFSVVVWNRDLVTLKNLMPALREASRVLQPGGVLVLAIPNLAAAHNRLLLLAGRQPTTLHISNGDHVRGMTAQAMTCVLRRELQFHVEQMVGVGIAPVMAAVLPRPLRGLGHTVLWVLRKRY